jgi:hypothetical protein
MHIRTLLIHQLKKALIRYFRSRQLIYSAYNPYVTPSIFHQTQH